MNVAVFIKYFARILTVFLILPLHECAHAWVAKKMGDDTASLSGRITVNPLAHIDIIGCILIVLTGFGWAKPVPINPSRMKDSRLGITLTALAGPVSNLLAAFVMMVVLQILYGLGVFELSTSMSYLLLLLKFFVQVNIGLAVFNLIPIPPLDGDKVLSYFTPWKYKMWMQQHQQIISIVFLIILVTGILSTPLGWIDSKIYTFFYKITKWIPIVLGAK
ncbi:MAG: site-2 protease family protein [Oscillospiraceae bacterium]|nr:site-2 protease family protein [Oscillospiraceae bacterium]MDD6085926.1 site-2 protease family protein [Oscillospiraceae bacterium]MDY3257011.1 site-2 protease family protein [Ruminococcus callidus]